MTTQKIPTERPMLFNAPMVRATLDDSKTQTRRVAKLPHQNPLGKWEPTSIGGPNGGHLADGSTVPEQGAVWHTRTGDCLSCPYGQPGDRLWVREAWSIHASFDRYAPSELTHLRSFHYWADGDAVTGKKRPSIHMPRWASRILLEIVSVRIERLQDISDADCIAEGIGLNPSAANIKITRPGQEATTLPRDAYRTLWESINGPGSWDANPLVWVIEFKRVTET